MVLNESLLKMESRSGEIDLHKVPLTALTIEARTLLFRLLDTQKLLLSPEKLPRDWRGLAALVNISSEISSSFERDKKTTRVIEHWIQRNDGQATVGRLLEFVQKIDRYDIFDDFVDLQLKGSLLVNQPKPADPNQHNAVAIRGCQALMIPDEDIEEDLITFDDKIHGSPQFYHAYVLYAMEDKSFVEELLLKMRELGYKICTEEDLLPDHQTTFAPVSRLISSERCHRIVLVYSPEFLSSPANTFYMNYAQAVGIEMKKPKIIPVMYKTCVLPPQVTFYHKLYYSEPGSKTSYDFWEKLRYSLDKHCPRPKLMYNGDSSTMTGSSLFITELSQTYDNGQLAITQGPSKSISMNGIDHISHATDTISLASQSSMNISQRSLRKSSYIKRILSPFKIGKKKSKATEQ